MTGTALVPYQIDEDAKLGPAMEALNPTQRQFVLALLQTGCTNSKAAEIAGYKGGPNTLKATGWRLAHDARIQAAIQEEAQKLIRTTTVMAINVIADIAKDKRVAARDRIKAAVELLNRGGLPSHTEHLVTVDHGRPERTVQELMAHIALKCRELGVDSGPVFERIGMDAPTDADFEVVDVSPVPAGHALPLPRNLTDPTRDEDWTIYPERKDNV